MRVKLWPLMPLLLEELAPGVVALLLLLLLQAAVARTATSEMAAAARPRQADAVRMVWTPICGSGARREGGHSGGPRPLGAALVCPGCRSGLIGYCAFRPR